MVLVVLAVVSLVWKSGIVNRTATAVTIDGQEFQRRRGELLLSECLPQLFEQQFLLHQLSRTGHQLLPEKSDHDTTAASMMGRGGSLLV
ncbi:MAG: hypothetical protein V8R27_04495 [Oscillospiraceae bacterium]